MRCFHSRCALDDIHPDDYGTHVLGHIAQSLDHFGEIMAINLDTLNTNLDRIAAAAERGEASNTEAADQASIDAAATKAGSIADGLEGAFPAPAAPAPTDTPAPAVDVDGNPIPQVDANGNPI